MDPLPPQNDVESASLLLSNANLFSFLFSFFMGRSKYYNICHSAQLRKFESNFDFFEILSDSVSFFLFLGVRVCGALFDVLIIFINGSMVGGGFSLTKFSYYACDQMEIFNTKHEGMRYIS